jgi:hypothetical protein
MPTDPKKESKEQQEMKEESHQLELQDSNVSDEKYDESE